MEVLKAVERVNEKQKHILFEKLQKVYPEGLKGKTISLWGLSFKPETDDMRESTALVIIDRLTEAGCNIRAYDPVAMDECRRRRPDAPITYCRDMYDAVLDADALLPNMLLLGIKAVYGWACYGCIALILGFLLFDSPIRRHRSYMLPWRFVGKMLKHYYGLGK